MSLKATEKVDTNRYAITVEIDAETFDTVIPIVYEAKNGNHTVYIPKTNINLTVKCMNNSIIKVVKN